MIEDYVTIVSCWKRDIDLIWWKENIKKLKQFIFYALVDIASNNELIE